MANSQATIAFRILYELSFIFNVGVAQISRLFYTQKSLHLSPKSHKPAINDIIIILYCPKVSFPLSPPPRATVSVSPVTDNDDTTAIMVINVPLPVTHNGIYAPCVRHFLSNNARVEFHQHTLAFCYNRRRRSGRQELKVLGHVTLAIWRRHLLGAQLRLLYFCSTKQLIIHEDAGAGDKN
ncbi:hypothetical protein J6590_023986 [Homalodisca vitripennis]|nr:hypothetical protein J6590_023986 [Homalodisca vitripennis]